MCVHDSGMLNVNLLRLLLLQLATQCLVLGMITPVSAQTPGEWIHARGNEAMTGQSPVELRFPLEIAWQFHMMDKPKGRPEMLVSGAVVRAELAKDGSRKWVYERANPALSLRSSAGVVLADGAVYAGFAGGKMIALRANDGKIVWEVSVALPKGTTEIERIAVARAGKPGRAAGRADIGAGVARAYDLEVCADAAREHDLGPAGALHADL